MKLGIIILLFNICVCSTNNPPVWLLPDLVSYTVGTHRRDTCHQQKSITMLLSWINKLETVAGFSRQDLAFSKYCMKSNQWMVMFTGWSENGLMSTSDLVSCHSLRSQGMFLDKFTIITSCVTRVKPGKSSFLFCNPSSLFFEMVFNNINHRWHHSEAMTILC